ncbi:hypothetical protein GW915_13815 [bacterium]|nr:hypothetical protein [bacterium]
MSFKDLDYEILVTFGAEFLPCVWGLKSKLDKLEKSLSFSGQYKGFSEDLYPHYGTFNALHFTNIARFIKAIQTTGLKCSEFDDWQARTEALDIMKCGYQQLELFCNTFLDNSIPEIGNEAQMNRIIEFACKVPMTKFEDVENTFKELAERSENLNSTTIAALVAQKDKKKTSL